MICNIFCVFDKKYLDILHPSFHVKKRFFRRKVEHYNYTISSPEITFCHWSETLLAWNYKLWSCSIPLNHICSQNFKNYKLWSCSIPLNHICSQNFKNYKLWSFLYRWITYVLKIPKIINYGHFYTDESHMFSKFTRCCSSIVNLENRVAVKMLSKRITQGQGEMS